MGDSAPQTIWHFDQGLRHTITKNLQGISIRQDLRSDTRRAAVALTLVNSGSDSQIYNIPNPDPDTAALVLTRRSERLHRHAGQWALPGGGLDEGETAEAAALRELREEVGVYLSEESIIGRLDDFTTRSGFTITPVVIWGKEDPELIPNLAEVESIHRIPLTEFMRDDAPILESIPESDNPVLLMPVGSGWIATPTGAIIYQFREVALLGRQQRVAHFEQPYFAWQ